MLQNSTHYFLHFIFPAILAYFFFKNDWKKAWMIMVLTMLVDVDHLIANPFFDPNRCSIGFHPLHTVYAIIVYVGFLFIPIRIFKIIGVGLLFHIITDLIDCYWMFSKCNSCFENWSIFN